MVLSEIEHASFYCTRPPFTFFKLLSANNEDVQEVLRWSKDLWVALESAEIVARTDDDAGRFLVKLMWPASTFVREVLVGLYECDFTRVLTDLKGI